MSKDKEMLAVFDSRGNHVGAAERAVVHKNALWHPTFICLVYVPDSETVIMQIKSGDKIKTNAQDFEIDFSAGGHITANEDPMTSHRELEEELGLSPDQYKASFLGLRQSAANILHEFSEFEWQYVWLVALESDLDAGTLNYEKKEVDGLIEIGIKDLLSLFNKNIGEIKAKVIMQGSAGKEVDITLEHFVPAYISGENIMHRLTDAARRACSSSVAEALFW